MKKRPQLIDWLYDQGWRRKLHGWIGPNGSYYSRGGDRLILAMAPYRIKFLEQQGHKRYTESS